MNIISLGAGVQSSTLALMAKHGEITPMPDAAIFADTQAEPKAVYEWLDWLEKQLPFKVVRVSKGELGAANNRVFVSKKTGKPYRKIYIPTYGEQGPLPRKCTTDFKLVPIYRYARQYRPVTMWIGISLDEASRMKEPFRKWVKNRYPLIELNMRRSDCLRWMSKKGRPKGTHITILPRPVRKCGKLFERTIRCEFCGATFRSLTFKADHIFRFHTFNVDLC